MSGQILDADDSGGSWVCESGDGTTGVAGSHPASVETIVIGLKKDDGVEVATFLTSKTARKVAVTLLELADRADGNTPLVFMPDCPVECRTCTGAYPPGHPSESGV